MSEPPFIRFRQVRKGYEVGGERLTIFSSLDLDIAKGEFLAIMGPSGSGKSTMLNLLAGIDSVDGGELHVGNHRLDQMGEGARTAWRSSGVGIVFQFYNLLPALTAAQNIELPLMLKPGTARERRTAVDKVMALVGLQGRQKQQPSLMSGGQQQRVGIARAIVGDPGLLLCDEPTGDLDRRSADDILEILGYLNREMGKTIVMVTHDDRAARHAGRVLHLDKGVFAETLEVA